MCIIIIVILESQSALGLSFLTSFLVYLFHCLSLHCKVRMFFIPSCPLGWLLSLCLSVLRTLRSVLTGFLEPLRGTLKVCCMYYTDVFLGTKDDIDKLKNALEAELKVPGLTGELKAQLKDLASGLESFIGYDKGGSLNGKGIGKNGHYASSYKDASWPDCNSGSCSGCQNSSSSCSHSVSPCHGSCCPDCDVKKAAKIFLGMLPCLYYALQYLYDKSKGGWKNFKISDHDKPLHRFLVGMGFELQKLDQSKKGSKISSSLSSLINGSNPLQSLYEKSKNYFTSRFTSLVPSSTSSDSKPKPKTVRSMLLWLSGLPFASGFEALLKHCERLCLATKDSVKFNDFESSLYASCFLSPFVLATIQWPGTSEIFPLDSFINSKSLYPEDHFDLFNMLLENVRKMYIPLNFLRYQCDRDKNLAGWRDCAFGQGCAEKFQHISSTPATTASAPNSSCCISSAPKGYLCTKTYASNVHEHCTKVGVECRGFEACDPKGAHTSGINTCTAACPHPLLMFLVDGSLGSQSQDSYSLFMLPEGSSVPLMGFSKAHLPSPGRWGRDLSPILKEFCDSSSSSLANLFKILTCISRTPPETLGEFFAFFKKFKDPSVFKKDFADYASKEPGGPNGQNFTTAFQTALEKLYGSSHSGSPHLFDLQSLIGCHANKASNATCGPYLYSLTGDVYDIFIDSPGMYLSWICYLPKDFKTLLEEFKQKFSDCCSSGKCQKIVECPCALPLIYSRGFQFMSPSGLGCVNSWGQEHGKHGGEGQSPEQCTRKSCQDFIDQLGKVISGDPLQTLIAEIESFLWSIRLPFVYAFLYIWILVISYFYYVQFYKLDLLHVDSHLHLPRSFKILPSTLFSDASSKLKDLSYFSL
ncbi:variant erythrocyte surface antigen-1 family protein [Babesia divergens]|uniref:Variant erythrocyte surface antigen-1 family protein n=1 Tax=Babesia divergens TaxID=32595 RepID=A0AAD9LJT5_BABDI|nr:variant erythrocyte surface antigen-1 family protein [Babesia divergens]